jgi:hypothetical protein
METITSIQNIWLLRQHFSLFSADNASECVALKDQSDEVSRKRLQLCLEYQYLERVTLVFEAKL